MSANVKGGPTPTMTTPLRGGYPRHPGGARELLDHVADIASILATSLAQHEGDHRREADQADGDHGQHAHHPSRGDPWQAPVRFFRLRLDRGFAVTLRSSLVGCSVTHQGWSWPRGNGSATYGFPPIGKAAAASAWKRSAPPSMTFSTAAGGN